MADDKEADQPGQPDDHLTANKPSASGELQGNPVKPAEDLSRLRSRRWRIRLLLSLATGLVVSLTAYLCAWYEYRNFAYFGMEQTDTRQTLEALKSDVDRHQQATGQLPKSLMDLESVQNRTMRVDDAGRPMDGWGRPIHYQLDGGSYAIFSYGMDGQPGGHGLDADLYAGKVDHENESPTLWQFATLLDNGMMLKACVLAGAFALALCLIASEGWQGNRSLAVILVTNAVTAFFAILTALVISGLHLPSGH